MILTCMTCTRQRELQPHLQHANPGGQTRAHCEKCRDITVHLIGEDWSEQLQHNATAQLTLPQRKTGR